MIGDIAPIAPGPARSISKETGSELISTVAGEQLLVQSLAEQDDGATWTLFSAGSAVARHPAREQSRGDLFRRRRLCLLCDWLAAAAAEYGCAIHPSVLMTNPLHLLVTPGGPQRLPRTMQSLGRRTVRPINARVRRTGSLWGRALSRGAD
jgi:hypothetical protein